MKKIVPVLLAVILCMSLFAGCGKVLTADEQAYNKNLERAKTLTELVNEKFTAYGNLDEKFYKEYMNQNSKAYLWSQFSLTGKQYAYVKADESDAEAKEMLREQVDMFERYKHTDSTASFKKYHSGQGILSGQGTVFFDDNIWAVRNLLYAYEVLGDQKYLDYAKATIEFVYSGWDDQLGGLVWNETGLTAAGNAADLERGLSANGASVFVSCQLYTLTGEQRYLDEALKFYDFCKTLQDPVTKFYNNGRHTILNPDGSRSDGSINKAKYSYNPGSMIISDLRLYEITEDEKYLTDALESAEAAYKAFALEEGGVTFINDFQWFNTVLLDSYVQLYEYDKEKVGPYIETFEKQLDYAYRKKRSEIGLLPEKYYDSGWKNTSNQENYRLLIQAANAEQFSLVAQYYKLKIDAA